ncbi:MAG TPA: MFS transporter [Thermodesulfobacteriota bacterium]
MTLPYRYAVLGLVLAIQASATIGTIGLPALAPLIRADLGLSRTEAGSLVSPFYVGSLVIGVPAGYLADRLGVRWTLVAGQAVIALFLFALAAVGSGWLVPLAIGAAGFGFALVNPTTTKAVIAWFPLASRATAVGVKQTGLPLGGAIGAAVLPGLALAVGWRDAIRATALLVALCAVATALVYRERTDEGGAAAPRPGSAWAVLRNGDLWRLSLVTVLFATVQVSWTGYFVLFLTETAGRSVVEGGAMLALANVAGIGGRIAFGLLSDRVFGGRRRIVLVIAGAGSGLVAAATALVGPGTPSVAVALLAVVFGMLGIGWNGVQLTLLVELAGKALAGTAVGLGLAVSALGVILGPPAFGRLVSLVGGYGPAWVALAGAMALALLLLATVREPARRV